MTSSGRIDAKLAGHIWLNRRDSVKALPMLPEIPGEVSLLCSPGLVSLDGRKGMLAYFCSKCRMYFREMELLKGKTCPECQQVTKPHLVLGGKVLGESHVKRLQKIGTASI